MNNTETNPHLWRPLKQLIPYFLELSDKYKRLQEERDEITKRADKLYSEKHKVSQAIQATCEEAYKPNLVLLPDGRAVIIEKHRVEVVAPTELVATVKRE